MKKSVSPISPIVLTGLIIFGIISLLILRSLIIEYGYVFKNIYFYYPIIFIIGIYLVEKIISTLFPRRGEVLTILNTPALPLTAGPVWVVLFTFALGFAIKYSLPAWIYLPITIIAAVILLRIIDTDRK